jgi:DNA-binding GntR family transcriptional regulator
LKPIDADNLSMIYEDVPATADLKIARVTVQSQLADKLRSTILSGLFKPGTRLVEARLCELFAVSRTSIREALRQLAAERLVVIAPNRGPSVAVISWDEVHNIYKVRELLEGEAVALFAIRANPSQLFQLRQALQRFEAATRANDPLERLASTQDFYDVILNGCGNRIIMELLQGLMARITFLRSRSMSSAGRPRQSLIEMRRIFDAIKAGDVKGARSASTDHVRSACAAARQVFHDEPLGASTSPLKPRRTRRPKARARK